LQAAVVIRRQRAVERWGGWRSSGSVSAIWVSPLDNSIICEVSHATGPQLLGMKWEVRTKAIHIGEKKINWGSNFFSPNLVLRGKFHPQFWICLTCCCTAPSLLAHFLYYLTIMPCQKQDPANLLNWYEVIPSFMKWYPITLTLQIHSKLGMK
jgi:hypothetical protein